MKFINKVVLLSLISLPLHAGTAAPIPEPSIIALLMSGIIAAIFIAKNKK